MDNLELYKARRSIKAPLWLLEQLQQSDIGKQGLVTGRVAGLAEQIESSDALIHRGCLNESPRSKRMRLQHYYAPTPSLRLCGCVPLKSQRTGILYNHSQNKARYSGVQSCDNSLCVSCYFKKRGEVAEIVTKALQIAKRRNDYAAFLTLTMPTMKVETQFQAITKAWNVVNLNIRRFFERRGLKYGYGSGIDLTITPGNFGKAHIHIHACLIAFRDCSSSLNEARRNNPLTDQEHSDLEALIIKAWSNSIEKSTGKRASGEAQLLKRITDYDEAVSLYTTKATDTGKTAKEVLSLWNKKGAGLSWLDFVLLCSEEPSYIPQYQDVLRSLKNKKLVRLSTLLKAYVEEQADQGHFEEPEEEETSFIQYSPEFHKGLVKSGLSYYALDLVEEYYTSKRHKDKFSTLLELAALSLHHHRSLMVTDWVEILLDAFASIQRRH
jgi:hypothetical protein